MSETIISDSEILEYALILLLLSPFVLTTLYLMVRYPNKPRYKKGKDEHD